MQTRKKTAAGPLTEKDVQIDFESCFDTLADLNSDWSKRMTCLKKLEDVITRGGGKYESFYGLFAKLIPNLSVQLNDLRSAISKETGVVICLAFETYGERFNLIAERLLTKESLLKNINNTNKIISETGHNCILSLIEHTKNPRIFPKLLDEMNNKNQNVRYKIMTYIARFLTLHAHLGLEKYFRPLEEVLKTGLNDASGDVRKTARQAFLLYEGINERAARDLFKLLELPTQKAINEDRSSMEIEVVRPKTTKTTSSAMMIESAPDMSHTSPLKANINSGNNQKRNVRTMSRDETRGKTPEFDAASRTKENLKKKVMNEERDVRPGPALTESNNNNIVSPPTQKLNRVGTSSKALGNQPNGPIKQHGDENEEEVFTARLQEEDLIFLLEKTGNENWATRLNAFDEISNILSTLPPNYKIPVNLLDNLFFNHEEHIIDPHYKVILSCLGSLQVLIQWASEARVTSRLLRILIPLFGNIDSYQDKVKGVSTKTLEVLESKINWTTIMEECVKAVMNNAVTAKGKSIKTFVLEYMGHLLQEHQNEEYPKELRKKIVNLVGKKLMDGKSTILQSFKLLDLLLHNDEEETIKYVLEQPQQIISQMRIMACQHNQAFENILKSYLQAPSKGDIRDNNLEEIDGSTEQEFEREEEQLEDCYDQGEETKMQIEPTNKVPRREVEHIIASSNPNYEFLHSATQQKSKENEGDPIKTELRYIKSQLLDIKNDGTGTPTMLNNLLKRIVKLLHHEDSEVVERALHELANFVSLDIEIDNAIEYIINNLLQLQSDGRFSLTSVLDDIFTSIYSKSVRIREKALDIFLNVLNDDVSLQSNASIAVLSNLPKIIRMLDKFSSKRYIDRLFNLMRRLINDKNAEIRKSVVFSLVELYFIAPESTELALKEYTASQQKLIYIYIKRRMDTIGNNTVGI